MTTDNDALALGPTKRQKDNTIRTNDDHRQRQGKRLPQALNVLSHPVKDVAQR